MWSDNNRQRSEKAANSLEKVDASFLNRRCNTSKFNRNTELIGNILSTDYHFVLIKITGLLRCIIALYYANGVVANNIATFKMIQINRKNCNKNFDFCPLT